MIARSALPRLAASALAAVLAAVPAEALLVIPAESPDARFAAAGAAYDEGRYGDAAALYRELIADGYATGEVHFNLGNAQFRAGEPGRAVLHYRRAGRLAPRDPDIRANLGFALEHTGALPPRERMLGRLLRRLAVREWAAAAAIAWWGAGLTLGVGALVRRRRRLLLRAAAACGAIAALSAVGLWEWNRLDLPPEAVVVAAGQEALFAPLKGTAPHFPLPPGSLVRIEERGDGWVRVALGGRRGWIPAAACETVR